MSDKIGMMLCFFVFIALIGGVAYFGYKVEHKKSMLRNTGTHVQIGEYDYRIESFKRHGKCYELYGKSFAIEVDCDE